MSIEVIIGILLVLVLIICVGISSGGKVKNSGDFLSGGGKAGSLLVCGSILGSLVSSQATIGTAQLAFHYGLSAWWFTLGSGIGCLCFAFGYSEKLRHSGCITEQQIITREYGQLTGSVGSILSSLGIFVSILAQVLACCGLMMALIPELPLTAAALISAALMCVYVIFGGSWGAGMGGVIKLLLLCFTVMLGSIYTLMDCGGIEGLFDDLYRLLVDTDLGALQQEANGVTAIQGIQDITTRFANLTARGATKDIGSGLSLLVGVLSTQTYAQAVLSGKNDRTACKGALLSALVIPLIGIGGIAVGLYMRSHYILRAEVEVIQANGGTVPEFPILENTLQVFPTFVLDHLPPTIAGIILGTLLISVVGGGAGLSLGMATIIIKDLLKKYVKSFQSPEHELRTVRRCIAAILIAAALIAVVIPGNTINEFGFLSMGLRGCVVFFPLTCALWIPSKVASREVLLGTVLAPCALLAGKLFGTAIDPLFIGMGVSGIFCLLGYLHQRGAQKNGERVGH